jgi:hypothetical protein
MVSLLAQGKKTRGILGFFPLIAPVGKQLYWKFFVLPGGPMSRGVWCCRVDVDNPYVLVVDIDREEIKVLSIL